MANHSPHPSSSLSPMTNRPSSAFEWPIPPTHIKAATNNELTVKDILDRYNDDAELLKYILTAKSEEDKKKAAQDTLKAEEARIQLRQMDLEYAREQSKRQHYVHVPPQQPMSAHPSTSQYPYYTNLAPVQQQVLARFHYPASNSSHAYHTNSGHHQPPPASPSVPYPHSAHPLCPPTINKQQKSPQPTSPTEESKKRNRTSSISPKEETDHKLSHNKVMEALKAKIQRGSSGGPLSPLTATPVRSLSISIENNKKRAKVNLPRPVMIQEKAEEVASPSPRSATNKPILPPIDTNLGRTKETPPVASQQQQQQQQQEISPSDHILLNTRRARSLSPSSTSSSNSSSNNTK